MSKKIKKLLIRIPIFIIILIVVLYLIVTSGFFLKNIGLPLIGRTIGTPISVESVNLSLISNPHLSITGLVAGSEKNPIITGKSIDIYFSLAAMLSNTIKVTSCDLDNINLDVVQSKDGRYNAPFLNEPSPAIPEEQKAKSSVDLPILDISNVKITNSNFAYVKDGDMQVDIKNFNMSSDSLKTGSLSDLKVSFLLDKFIADNVNLKNGSFNTNIKFELSKNYIPTSLQLITYLKNFKGEIKGRPISDRSIVLDVKTSLKENNIISISEASINEYDENTVKSSLSVTGDIALNPFNVTLQFEADPITSNLINFVTNTFLHKDFGDSVSLSMSGNLSLKNNYLSSTGRVNLNSASLANNDQKKPHIVVDTAVSYSIASDLKNSTLDIKNLNISIANQGSNFLSLKTNSEVKVNFNELPIKLESKNASITLSATNFPMPLLNAFLPNSIEISNGVLNSSLGISMSSNNKDAILDGKISVSDLSAKGPSFNINNLTLTQSMQLSFVNMETLFVKEFKTTITKERTVLLSLSTDGFYNLANGNGGIKVNIPQYSYNIIDALPESVMSSSQKETIKKELEPLIFKIKTDINFSFDKNKNTLSITKFLTDLKNKKAESISLALVEPFLFDLNKSSSGKLELKISSEKLDINLIKGFIPESNREIIKDGFIFVDAHILLGNNFKNISSYGDFGAKQMTVADKKIKFNDVSAQAKYNVMINENIAILKELNIILATQGRENLFLNLQEPCSINVKDFGFVSKLKLRTDIKNFSLPVLNSMLPKNNLISNGNLSSNIMVSSSDTDSNDLNVIGKIDIHNLNASFNGQNVKKGNFASEINSNFNFKTGDMTINKFVSKISCNNTYAGSVSFSGKLLNKYKDISLNLSFDINKWILALLGKSGNIFQQISQFSADGDMKILYNESDLTIKGGLNLPSLLIINQNGDNENINGRISLAINKNKNLLNISDVKANFLNNGANIFDLTAGGNIYFSKERKSTFNLTSNMLNLDELLKVYNALNPANSSEQVTQSEDNNIKATAPSPIDLSNINMKGEIYFKHIKYDAINLSLFSNLSIHNKAIELYPLEIKDMTGGSLITNIYLNPSYSDGYVYSTRGSIKNLNLLPFIETFLKNDFNNPQGMLSSSAWELEGKGFSSSDISKNLQGELEMNFNSLSLPLNLSKNKLLALIFEPIRIFAGIANEIPNITMPSDLNQAISLTSNLINQNNNLNFSQGTILIKMYAGVAHLNKFHFQGARNGIVRNMNFSGTIGPNNALNIMTDTSFGGIAIPMQINGTLDNPKPDYPDFVARFLTQNTKNLIQSTTNALGNIIQDAGNIRVRGGSGGSGGTIMEDVGSLLGNLTNN